MPEWEYKVMQLKKEHMPTTMTMSAINQPLLETDLNAIGQDRWELVMPLKSDLVTVWVFKRPKAE